jgi:hypothetical protein
MEGNDMSGTRLLCLGLPIVSALLLGAEAKKERPRTTEFVVPDDVKVIETKETRFQHDGDYLLRKGADVRLWGEGDCYVESGARVAFDSWNGAIVIKKRR